MNYLITSDTDLRRFIPNALATAAGEKSFYEKLSTWIISSEDWVANYFVSPELMPAVAANPQSDLLRVAASLAATEAIFRAVPSLDLILTPNGFGIVSNENVAPASKERIERLLATLEADRSFYIDRLITLLFQWTEWQNTTQHNWFRQSLFFDLSLARACDFKEHLWQHFLGLRNRAIEIENLLANRYFSPEQMEVFREEAFLAAKHPEVLPPVHVKIIKSLRALIVDKLTGGKITYEYISDLLDIMRKKPESFDEFISSDTAKLLEPPIFENTKKAAGYWF